MVSPTAARIYFYKSFWSMLRSQTPKLGFCELNAHKSCWTWPDSAPEPPKPSPEPSPEPCWTWPGSAPKPPGAFSGTFSRTFSGTLLNPTGLRTKASHTFSETFSEPCWTWPGSAPKPPKPSPKPCWTWPGSAPKPPRPSPEFSPEPSLRNLLNLTWLCNKASRNLLQNLFRNPVEPDMALHQSLPEPSPEPSPEPCSTWSGSAPKPPRPRPGTLLNLTWLCTKASQTVCGTRASRNLLRNLLRNPVELDLALHRSLPDLLRNLLRNPVELDLALHQSLPDLHRNLLRNPVAPEPCWTWPGSAPKLPLRNLLQNILWNPVEPDNHWRLLDLLWNLLRNLPQNPVEPDLALPQSIPDLLRNSPEPEPGACTSAYRGYSGLKTTLAYAAGEKMSSKHCSARAFRSDS